MATVRFEHFITAADTDDIDAYLDEYRRAGFAAADLTVRHNPGLRNGFVGLGLEYLEFIWVEDEELFEQGADTSVFVSLRAVRAAHRPFAVALLTDDVHAWHDDLVARGYDVPPVFSATARDAPPGAGPQWSLQPLPPPIVQGAQSFALIYHGAKVGKPRKVQVAPNTTYALAGVTFSSKEPEVRAAAWRDLLAPGEEIKGEDGVYETAIGPHFAVWMAPEEYQEHFGLSWKEAPHPFGELAALHVLAADLDKAEELIGAARGNVTRLPDKRTGIDTLFVLPDPRDGFLFAITERPIDEWLQERISFTGERLELA